MESSKTIRTTSSQGLGVKKVSNNSLAQVVPDQTDTKDTLISDIKGNMGSSKGEGTINGSHNQDGDLLMEPGSMKKAKKLDHELIVKTLMDTPKYKYLQSLTNDSKVPAAETNDRKPINEVLTQTPLSLSPESFDLNQHASSSNVQPGFYNVNQCLYYKAMCKQNPIRNAWYCRNSC
ncbi:hypothetical protein XELAEV_18030556mg [Xenopus laevis]|uniref:Uncharacterized protein n=1 Tax=Xenopus laevis TaxID=8355 RepID=A0A974HEU6_XENLA|nr:hypothetical protein XELAEV_18030556mg [Xenopus laevis]